MKHYCNKNCGREAVWCLTSVLNGQVPTDGYWCDPCLQSLTLNLYGSRQALERYYTVNPIQAAPQTGQADPSVTVEVPKTEKSRLPVADHFSDIARRMKEIREEKG